MKNEDLKNPNIWLAEEWRLSIATFVEDEDWIFKTVEENEDHVVCREPLNWIDIKLICGLIFWSCIEIYSKADDKFFLCRAWIFYFEAQISQSLVALTLKGTAGSMALLFINLIYDFGVAWIEKSSDLFRDKF